MRGIITIACVLTLGASVTAQMRWTGSAWEGEPMNLQVLPQDIATGELVRTMRSFTRALGVRCEHCHVGEGNDLSKFDFMSDKRPAKQVARKMLTMVRGINETLATVGEPAPAGASKVTCYTCHRGTTKPLTAPAPAEGRGGGTPRIAGPLVPVHQGGIR